MGEIVKKSHIHLPGLFIIVSGTGLPFYKVILSIQYHIPSTTRVAQMIPHELKPHSEMSFVLLLE
jgi:hypothetical protein